ncbi:hypothetical protein [Actinomadura rugatobispora]|uniref:Uncharacterized protein n=1 Tax=Actinomadura rugatobispora TaxID=1994 RepID=A0ABW1A6G3_9ACTN|nr:hypothetical protein GCM10010200_015340 [Actinomadura rugatobispora]
MPPDPDPPPGPDSDAVPESLLGAERVPVRYDYVGPSDIRARVRPGEGGAPIRSPGDVRAWLEGREPGERGEPFTYVVDLGGTLRLAPRRSEHVACAGGGPVLAAGEITFDASGPAVVEVSNQSTGYCPGVECWPEVAAALDGAGLRRRPDGFTHPFVFRRCGACGELNLVKDAHYVCAVCDADLPEGPEEGFRTS